MGKGDQDRINRDGRGQTDQSLRVEREKANAAVETKQQAIEEEADQVVRAARIRADQVVQVARDEADRDRSQPASSERERRRADVVLEDERSNADAVLETERAERRRFLAHFLAVERQATDKDLEGERAEADAAISNSDQLLATVSHDLRSLLGGLLLNAELMVERAPDGVAGDEMRKYAGMSHRLVTRMSRLVQDLVDLASISAGRLAIIHERVELDAIVRDVLDAFEPLAAGKGITLVADAEGRPLDAQLDGDRILQVLANLVSNAVKFTPPEGRITLAIRCEADEIRFAVSDTGMGIPEGELASVFERFSQVNSDRRGLGLGLYISKSIVEAHGGKMWVESQLGAGTTFYFTVPASPS
jgi:signal transduction histidine kinase